MRIEGVSSGPKGRKRFFGAGLLGTAFKLWKSGARDDFRTHLSLDFSQIEVLQMILLQV